MSSQLNPNLETSASQQLSLFDRFFRDRDGNIVIAQKPNLPVLVASAATLLQFVVPAGNVHTVLELVAFGVWFTWAWLELFSGVNYFRRSLGLLVLVGLLAIGLNLNL